MAQFAEVRTLDEVKTMILRKEPDSSMQSWEPDVSVVLESVTRFVIFFSILGLVFHLYLSSLTLEVCRYLRVSRQSVLGLVMRNGGQKVVVKHISDILNENWSVAMVSLKEWVAGERYIQLKKVS